MKRNIYSLIGTFLLSRELAMQSHQVASEVGGPYKSVCIYGGVPKPAQKKDLSAGAEIVVATPGRLLDLLEENALSLEGITSKSIRLFFSSLPFLLILFSLAICYLVLDEADRMLDDGFEPAIRAILSRCPASGQSSATA